MKPVFEKYQPNHILVFAGIYKNDGPFDVMIDITKIEKLHTIPSVTEVHYLL